MNQKSKGDMTRSASDGPAPASRVRILLFTGIVVMLGITAFLTLTLLGKKRSLPGGAPSSVAKAEPAAESVLVEFEKLKGKWLRPDGGYVIEIKRLLPQNELEVAYLNPNPIHVGKAKLYKERGFVKVFVELQDVNYPGSTYTLIYDIDNDQLRGVYYQATQQQEFQIVFERLPPGS